MAQSFYFYDLETSGINARDARIMQFAGQRTDMDLNPIGEPHNILIKLTDEIVPDPDAILITGITPQKTLLDGITEVEFLKIFFEEIATPDTIFTGFNTVRFDDEFMRFLLYRNFYDAYEWQWSEGRSRWDLLDVIRMTRALRPDGIKWPIDEKGMPTNRLELLTSINGLAHENAHDALNDVQATIDVARLVKTTQPKLFDYLLHKRDKKSVEQLVMSGKPYIYTSGKYAGEFEKTTVVATVCEHPIQSGGAFVFDLRYDPLPFADLSANELAEAWRRRSDEPGLRLPVKTLKYNRCPAVAPLSVLDTASQERLALDPKVYEKHHQHLLQISDAFCKSLKQAVAILDKKQLEKYTAEETEVDAQLYDNFLSGEDKPKMNVIRNASGSELSDALLQFKDQRLQALLPLYKARNYREHMTDDERSEWEAFRQRRLSGGGTTSRLATFFNKLGELAEQPGLTSEQQYLLEELQLYGQSIMPDQN